ncbi:MAG: cation:proton antiporter [Acidimicrobiia bacterium]|nr:cation:proton antiporter [Acidimicrobiia bacterium]
MHVVLAAEAPNALLTEHEVLVFLAQLALLIGAARLLGGFMKLIGQPAVVGELVAGILLGPSVFGRWAPESYEWLFGEPTVQSLMFGLAWLGVIMLLVVIGFETDLAIIGRFRTAALSVAAGALAVPAAVTLLVSRQLPASFIGDSVDPWVFGGFVALALSVSALPVVAKILQDLGFLRRNFGQITLAAGMTMDTIGWLLLAALSGIAQDGFDPAALGTSFGGLVAFLLAMILVGRPVLDRLMKLVMERGSSRAAALTVAFVAALAGGVVTQALKLEAILGAFVMGILLSRLRHQLPQVQTTLETVTAAIFAPIFFAFSGLRVDIGLLSSAEAALWTVGLVVIAIGAKIVGTFAAGRMAGVSGRECLALGSGLSALGAMGIVVAIVALNLGVISETGYTVVVVVAIVTSVVAPMLLKWVVRGWAVPDEERRRLDREELLASSEILSSKRVLVPTRGGRNSRYAARLLADVLDDPEFTILLVEVTTSRWRRWLRSPGGSAAAPADVLDELEGLRHRVVRKVATDPAAAIADESRLGYDLVLLGASEEERDGPGGLFSTVVDRVLARVDLPAVIVRIPGGDDVDLDHPDRVLVPVVSTRVTRAAEELAYSIVRRNNGTAMALHVVNRPEGQGVMLEEPSVSEAIRTAQEMVTAAAGFGERLGVTVETGVRVASHAEEEVVEVANGGGFDLAVIGASNRPVSDRPFFGHRVRYMIERSRIPVVIVTLPTR